MTQQLQREVDKRSDESVQDLHGPVSLFLLKFCRRGVTDCGSALCQRGEVRMEEEEKVDCQRTTNPASRKQLHRMLERYYEHSSISHGRDVSSSRDEVGRERVSLPR